MKILLAVDGSEFTRSTLDFLVRLPLAEDGEFTLVAVVPDAEAEAESDAAAELEGLQEEMLEAAERVLEDAAEHASSLGFRVTRMTRTGPVAREIVRCGAEIAADLIVVGSHGLRGFKRFLLGSVAHKVLTYAPCSVLVVRPKPPARTDPGSDSARPVRALVATDGSGPSRAVIAQLAALTGAKWCEVRILTVLELVMFFRTDIRQRLTDSWRQKTVAAKQHLAEAANALSPTAADVRTRLVEAPSTSDAILDAAEEFDADLIVVGSTGKGRVEQALLGSVSARIARYATCSVWVGR